MTVHRDSHLVPWEDTRSVEPDDEALRRRRIGLYETLMASSLPTHVLWVCSRYRDDGGEVVEAFLLLDAMLGGRMGTLPADRHWLDGIEDLIWSSLSAASFTELDAIEESLRAL